MKLYSKRKQNYIINYSNLVDLVKNTWEYFFRNDYFVNKLNIAIQNNTTKADVNSAFTEDTINLITIYLHFNPFPLSESVFNFNHDKIFDFIEFLYYNCSKPVNGYYFNDTTETGWNYQEYRYEKFDELNGKENFIDKVNSYLPYYEQGYELSENGEIVLLKNEVQEIINQSIPKIEIDNLSEIPNKIQDSILKFRNKRGDFTLIKDSLKGLADVNERLREFIINEKLINETESQLLFKIFGETANKFHIRHDNKKQLNNYDPIFLSMLFHVYLSTIHASIRIINQNFKNK